MTAVKDAPTRPRTGDGSMLDGPRVGGQPLDLVSVITVWLALVFLIPASQVVPAVGAAGRPAVLLGYGMFVLWLASRFLLFTLQPGPQPMRWLVGAFAVTHLISYGLGVTRGLAEVESLASDREIIIIVSMLTATLAVIDGVPSRDRLDDLLLRLVGFAAACSFVGVLQFFFTYDLAQFLTLPGIQLNGEPISAIDNRSGFNRVAGTGGHAIEFGSVMAMVLPISLHYLLHDEPGRRRRLLAVATFLLALGVPMSISRTSTIAIALTCVGLTASWSGRMVYRAGAAGLVSLVVLRAAVPSLIGSITALFFDLGDDLSVSARTSDYPVVFRFIRERPLFGRGPGTFSPPEFLLLDNQILSSAVNIGLVGLTTLLAFYIGSMLMLRRVVWTAATDETRHLAMSLSVSVLTSTVVLYFADMLFFAIYTSVAFLLFGIAGVLYRVRHEQSRFDLEPRWYLKKKLRVGHRRQNPLPLAVPPRRRPEPFMA